MQVRDDREGERERGESERMKGGSGGETRGEKRSGGKRHL